MNILITGGNGFIGSHLTECLLRKGHNVTIFDRNLPSRADVDFRLGDIKDSEAVMDAVNHCDRWVNLAGLLGTQEMLHKPHEAVAVNIDGALNVFQAAALHKKPGLQIAVGNHWMNNPYSITKTTAERFALMYNKELGTKIRVVRGMNVYGPRQKHRPIRKIFPNLAIPALLNKPITIYGDGTQVMDLIYADDISEILARIVQLDCRCDVVYEAGAGPFTINQAVELVLAVANSRSEVRHVPMRPGEEERSVVAISDVGWKLLEEEIGYTPKDLTPMRVAFEETVDYYMSHLGEYPWDE